MNEKKTLIKSDPVAAVQRALSVLGAFRYGERAITLTMIAERTGLYKSTVLRLLQTLMANDYISAGDGGLYSIGPKPLILASMYQQSVQDHELVLPVLRYLVDQTNESASYSVARSATRICLYRVDSPHRIRDHLRPGDAFPLGKGASGKVLAAYANPLASGSEAVIKQVLIRSFGETDPYATGMAAPVFQQGQIVTATVALSGPRDRFTDEAMLAAEVPLLNAARDLSARLGGDLSLLDSALSHRKRLDRSQ